MVEYDYVKMEWSTVFFKTFGKIFKIYFVANNAFLNLWSL